MQHFQGTILTRNENLGTTNTILSRFENIPISIRPQNQVLDTPNNMSAHAYEKPDVVHDFSKRIGMKCIADKARSRACVS